MFNKLKQFKDLRDQGKQMKAMMDEIVVVGGGANNAVMITVNGSHEVLGVEVKEGQDKATLERGIKEAITEANKKLQQQMLKTMQANGGAMEALKNLGLGGNQNG
jgi:DNA-binding protein YbaB